MSTFFKVQTVGNDERQLFSVVLPQVSGPTKAHPTKYIGFCIVSLVGQVIINTLNIQLFQIRTIREGISQRLRFRKIKSAHIQSNDIGKRQKNLPYIPAGRSIQSRHICIRQGSL